jgi:hypothetical protein
VFPLLKKKHFKETTIYNIIDMPAIYINTQNKELDNNFKRAVINNDLLACYQKLIEKQNINAIIKSHKSCINKMQLHGKNKYNTLTLLQHYKNTNNKRNAFYILTCSLNNRGVFSM